MRAFMIVCLVAYASAAPQYNYQPGSGGPSSGRGFSGDIGVHSIAGPGISSGIVGGYSDIASGLPDASLIAPIPSGISGGSVPQGHGGHGHDNGVVLSDAGYDKHFYFHAAPEDDFEDNDGTQQLANTLKKNLRVVFIKAPENKGLQNAAIHLAKQTSEDKTAIYVLSKQTDLSELRNQLKHIKESHPQKPEVHFVKYRTPEEAEHAQHAIQAQYDTLAGPSHSSHEGIAPVLNYASATPIASGTGSSYAPTGSIGSSGPAGSIGSIGSSGPAAVGISGAGSVSGSAEPSYLPPKSTYLPVVRI